MTEDSRAKLFRTLSRQTAEERLAADRESKAALLRGPSMIRGNATAEEAAAAQAAARADACDNRGALARYAKAKPADPDRPQVRSDD